MILFIDLLISMDQIYSKKSEGEGRKTITANSGDFSEKESNYLFP